MNIKTQVVCQFVNFKFVELIILPRPTEIKFFRCPPIAVNSTMIQVAEFFIAATTCSGRERSAWDISCFIKKYPPTRLVAAVDVFYNATITSIGGVSMKKIIALVLTVAICVGLLAGCGTVGSNKKNTPTTRSCAPT